MNNAVVYQRIEGLAVFCAATFVYFQHGYSWIAYILLLFVFDVFMVGYIANPRIGALLYNFGHSFVAPAILVVVYAITQSDFILGLSCLWFAHIGIDRALGYGLKHTSGFHDTHLGKIGK